MSNIYSRNEIEDECNKAMKIIRTFYAEKFINRTGCISGDEMTLYTEVIADYVIGHINDFKTKIPQIDRDNYFTGHDGNTKGEKKNVPNDFTNEKRLAKDMFRKHNKIPLDHIGIIVDYQTPLETTEEKAGEIDLLAVNDKAKKVFILELKRPRKSEKSSEKTMLRCVLEAYTYLKTVNKDKLFESFKKANYNWDGYELCASPFVHYGDNQYKEINVPEMRAQRPKLLELMELLNITPYYYHIDDNGNYTVTK